jgi:flagellar hook-length control protein FliK
VSEAPSNVVAPSSTSSALRAHNPRKVGDGEAGAADYAAAASLAQAAAELAALAGAGSTLIGKSASHGGQGFAVRDRGTSSRHYASNGSAVQAMGSAEDPTSRATQELKTGSSRHDPSARLAGKVADDSAMDAGENNVAGRETREARVEPTNSRSAAGTLAPGASSTPSSNVSSNAVNAAVQAAAGAVGAAAGQGTPGSGASTASSKATGVGAGAPTAEAQGVAAAAGQSGGTGAQGQGTGTSTATNANAGGKNAVGARGFEVTLHKAKAGTTTPSSQAEAQDSTVEAQAARGLAAVLRQKGGNVTIRLAPDSLGDLKVSMRLDGVQVWANIEATSESARELLEGQRDSLRVALEAHGLKVERLDVTAVKPDARDGSERSGVKDHAVSQENFAWPDGSANAGEDRRSAEGWGRTPQEFVPGRSAGGADEDAGGAGEMVLTVRGAPVTLWTEPEGQTMRLRVDAVA